MIKAGQYKDELIIVMGSKGEAETFLRRVRVAIQELTLNDRPFPAQVIIDLAE